MGTKFTTAVGIFLWMCLLGSGAAFPQEGPQEPQIDELKKKAPKVFIDCRRCASASMITGPWEETIYDKTRESLWSQALTASLEEVLLQRQELATEYRFFFSVGLSYSFGSIFSNVVNPRFGGRSYYY